jgi:IS5 family transposase
MMVVGYLYGITSERRLCEEVHLNLAYRWFCGLALEDRVPDHSTFSKNRHGRFGGRPQVREMFYEVVRQAIAHWLVGGTQLTVDATTVQANAALRAMQRVIAPFKPWRAQGIFPHERFGYDAERNEVICPAAQRLRQRTVHTAKRLTEYAASVSLCRDCPLKPQCTRARYRVVHRHWDREYLRRAEALRQTAGYRLSQRARKKIEHLFAEAKEQMGLRRARRRGWRAVSEQCLMTALVQNIKRIVAVLNGRSQAATARRRCGRRCR